MTRGFPAAAVSSMLAGAMVAAGIAAALTQDDWEGQRLDMVQYQLRGRGINQTQLLDAMGKVPRHLFVPQEVRSQAYGDQALPMDGSDGGLLQPYMSARMIELLDLDGSERVLEVGTGSGYDAAVLSRLAKEVYTIEISDRLGREARRRLASLGFDNVSVMVGDGHDGWPSQAPFDAILLTAAPQEEPSQLIEQLSMNGRMVVAVGGGPVQNLMVIEKSAHGLLKKRVEPVRIGPMSAEP